MRTEQSHVPTYLIRNAAGELLGVGGGATAPDALDDYAAHNGASSIEHLRHINPGADGFRADLPTASDVVAALSALLTDSGLSNREFARRVLGRDVRSLARYLGGDVIPPELADQILRMRVEVFPTAITIRVQR